VRVVWMGGHNRDERQERGAVTRPEYAGIINEERCRGSRIDRPIYVRVY
jgi:hypothetical protein